ncbi:hypothetical protein FACS1894102_4140 [Spirochaetia bacterium]|nr:hypothetical protein FACS1894102_4140 [Spirochaetia bacterium]
MLKLLQKKFSIIILTTPLVLAAIFTVIFVSTDIDHDCIGERCPVCLQIETAQKMLDGFTDTVLFVIACFVPRIFTGIKKYLPYNIIPKSLLQLKIKYTC